MTEEQTAALDAAISDALVRIQSQRAYIVEFSARGYDMKAAQILLSCLLTNLARLERQRREQACQLDIAVISGIGGSPGFAPTVAQNGGP